MGVVRYLITILDSFVKWWWAAITGVASILGWFATPSGGFTLGRLSLSLLLFGGMLVLFLLGSVLVKAYPWYAGTVEQPRVVSFVPRAAGASADSPVCTFVIEEAGWRLGPGHVFGLYSTRTAEACVAIVRVERSRHQDSSIQCVPMWIAPGQLRELHDDADSAKQLIVRREISEDVVDALTKKEP